jgi:catechol 2,3-dioxygenase-like lactoylglutathione lyase family enzyme
MNKAMPPASRPIVLGIHHLKFAVSHLSLSLAWYERVLGAHRISSLDHLQPDGSRFAVICEMRDWAGLYLELRENAAKALDDRSWDPVTLAVKNRQDLYAWVKWLDICGTQHSPVLTGLRGWLIVFEVRLRTLACLAW